MHPKRRLRIKVITPKVEDIVGVDVVPTFLKVEDSIVPAFLLVEDSVNKTRGTHCVHITYIVRIIRNFKQHIPIMCIGR